MWSRVLAMATIVGSVVALPMLPFEWVTPAFGWDWGLFVAIGHSPATELFGGKLDLDDPLDAAMDILVDERGKGYVILFQLDEADRWIGIQRVDERVQPSRLRHGVVVEEDEELAARVGLKVPYEGGREAPREDSSDLYNVLDAAAKF